MSNCYRPKRGSAEPEEGCQKSPNGISICCTSKLCCRDELDYAYSLLDQPTELDMHMTLPPQTPYEQASYDLNKFRERRMADRRATPRGTPDRRMNGAAGAAMPQQDKQLDDPNKDLH